MAKGTAPRSERFKKEAARLVTQASADTSSSSNEATLRHRLEQALSVSCGRLSIKALPYHFDVRLQLGLSNQFADVIHGAVIIEYEPPRSFNGREGQVLAHAKSQAEGYRQRVQKNEGRPLNDYAMVVWDGSHIAFGRDEPPVWSRIRAFDESAAMKLLDLLDKQGMPLVHPTLLTELIGPESKAGSELIPALFRIATERGRRAHAHTTRTGLLYSEWRRLCGQVLGNTSEHVTEFVRGQSSSHHEAYENDPDAFLFALNTHVALTAKLVAALSLPQAAQDLRDPTVDLRERIHQLDSGSLFAAAGIEGMLDGDFFSWVADDPEWHALSKPLGDILSQLDCLDFDVSKRTPEAARDLFKGIYEAFIPSALRHALGEYYTPDWLAEYLLDEAGWQPSNSLLDPTCGSGTFILEALRRRLADNCTPRRAADLLKGLYGTDLNPLAVLASRASLVVYLAPFFDRTHPVRLPIYLADAVNTVDAIDTFYSHRIQTERGVKTFVFPQQLVADGRAYRALDAIRRLLDAVPIRSTPGPAADGIYSALSQDFGLAALPPDEQNTLRKTVRGFVDLHLQGWNGIWCTILSERLAAATIPTVDFICGNPPWVKWSNLPPTYAALIKPRCDALGVFSQDRWVGGIEADISTVITYEAIDKWLKPGGVLAFVITGTLFRNESSEGFRRFEVKNRSLVCRVTAVEDFKDVDPFDNPGTHPTMLILQKGQRTTYPVRYSHWRRASSAKPKGFISAAEFRSVCRREDSLAAPVPGTDAGPWLVGSEAEHAIWSQLFGCGTQAYVARKGVTTDRNGIYFVRVVAANAQATCSILNDPELNGKTKGIARLRSPVDVEARHVFALLRGEGVRPFHATPDETFSVLCPQSGMHGDEELPRHSPLAWRYLSRYRKTLLARGSYRRYQLDDPYWSLWNVGPYTFSPFKVVWREVRLLAV